eukprot:1083919-Prorocentrum_minimum.AAC.2
MRTTNRPTHLSVLVILSCRALFVSLAQGEAVLYKLGGASVHSRGGAAAARVAARGGLMMGS